MTNELLFGLGFVAVIEGLVLALAPSHLEQVLEMLRRMGTEAMRYIGLASVAVGVLLIWLGLR